MNEKAPNTLVKGKVLSVKELQTIMKHKYSVQGTTLLDPIMQVFWCWIVEHIPLSVAPNTLTLTGLLLNGFTTIMLMFFCSDGLGQAPSIFYFLCALGLFLYQTLDAIDGKQARRTNSSSPLGELFDHGCDAMSIVFVVLGSCMTGQVMTSPCLFFTLCFLTMLVFYCAQWQAYVTGVLKFGYVDVTEAQMGVIFMYLLTVFFGPDIWNAQLFHPAISGKVIAAYLSLFIGMFTFYNYFKNIFGSEGQNTAHSFSYRIYPLLPILSMLLMAIYIALHSPNDIYNNYPVKFVMTFGVVSTKLSCKLVICHMAHSTMTFIDQIYLGPIILILVQCFVPGMENMALNIIFIYCAFDLLRYCTYVCQDLCKALNIYCFSIVKK